MRSNSEASALIPFKAARLAKTFSAALPVVESVVGRARCSYSTPVT